MQPEFVEMPSETRQDQWSVRMANAVLHRHRPETVSWRYEQGLLWKAIAQVGTASGRETYNRFAKETVDQLIDAQGNIRSYKPQDHNLDLINPGKVLFGLYHSSQNERDKHRYRNALFLLRKQLKEQPRTKSGGFWHKKIYPFQMWLDGIYMASPFYTEFAQTFEEPEAFEDVAHQITLIAAKTHDPQSGLYYHGWDEHKQQPWSDPETGCSPHFWGRAIGWYAMALVDVLDTFPESHPQRPAILEILQQVMAAVASVQDEESGVWFQIMDQGSRVGNYLEASASCMFVYTMVKGVRKGYLPEVYSQRAAKGYQGILMNFISTDGQGWINLERTCGTAGLGGNPYRDGSFDYYVGEKIIQNDEKGVGPFLLASLEMEAQKPSEANRV